MNVVLNGRRKYFLTVAFDDKHNSVLLINQKLLPHKFEIVSTQNYIKTAEAIKDMTVRGAPAIAATAAYGLAQGAREFKGNNVEKFRQHLRVVYERLASARPTAVDPVNVMKRIIKAVSDIENVKLAQKTALEMATRYSDNSIAECRAIGEHGAGLLKDGMTVLTHCNAGWLACVDIGTATAPMYVAKERGVKFTVFCNETRPRLQGASLTAWELAQAGIDHFVIADNAAGYFMRRGDIDLVIVGSDRIVARTGEVINKIGTYSKAVLAKQNKIPFYVAVPFSSIDWESTSADGVEIEERAESEVLGAWGIIWNAPGIGTKKSSNANHERFVYVRTANPTSHARNPGFDITPPEFVTGIITPIGIFKPGELWKNKKKFEGKF